MFFTGPSAVWRAFLNTWASGQLQSDLLHSGGNFAIGFSSALLAGVVLGIIIGWYRTIRLLLDPFLNAFYATPRIALVPLIIIIFGIGRLPAIVIVFLSAFFPILINTIVGVKTIDDDLLKAARAFCASDRQIFTTVALPGSVPFILTGVRQGVAHGLIGVVVSEMFVGGEGIGFMIAYSGQTFATERIFLGVVIMAGFGHSAHDGRREASGPLLTLAPPALIACGGIERGHAPYDLGLSELGNSHARVGRARQNRNTMSNAVSRLLQLDTCAVSDAIDKLGLPSAVTGIVRLSTDRRIAGRVLTVKLDRAEGRPPSGRHLCTAAIELARPGDVIVVEQRTGLDAASWGGTLSLGARMRGVAGAIVEGPARDIDESRELDFPVFARSHTAHTARGRIVEVATGEPITVGDVTVTPGDYVIADGTAVAFVARPISTGCWKPPSSSRQRKGRWARRCARANR